MRIAEIFESLPASTLVEMFKCDSGAWRVNITLPGQELIHGYADSLEETIDQIIAYAKKEGRLT